MYEGKLQNGGEVHCAKAVFPEGNTQEVAVKFTKRYYAEAHRLPNNEIGTLQNHPKSSFASSLASFVY